jgi:DivIVA domain-containing protein
MLVLAALVRARQFRQRRAAPVTIVFLVLGVAVVAAIALLAVGRLGELPEVEPDRPPTLLPDTRLAESEDVDSLRFAVGLRGYRMDEVDDVLDRLAADIAERDARITELERGASVPGPGAAVATATGSGTAWAEASAADFTPAADVVEPIRGASTE